MSDRSPSPPQQNPLQSDAVSGEEETPIQPDPAVSVRDPTEDHSAGEEEDDDEEGEEADSSMDLRIEPPIADLHVSAALASPAARRGSFKRKKGKAKGKGKPNARRLQVINEKLQNLRSNLRPVPFIPSKIIDFGVHDRVLKKLGLLDFARIEFDRTVRVDLIAELIANYNHKSRSSCVNGWSVKVNRADLARALRLKRDKGNVEVDLDGEDWGADAVGFVVGFVEDWLLLHEDMWMMPNEVMNWMKSIRDGHPEKVDWAGMLWFMVEKELRQGGGLRDCFYASHLQYLIRHQRPEVFLVEDPGNGEGDSVAEVMVVDDGDDEVAVKESDVVESVGDGRDDEVTVKESDVVESVGDGRDDEVAVKESDVVESVRDGRDDSVVEGPSTKLTLGQDSEKEEEEEEVKEVEMMDAEKYEESDAEEGGDKHEHEHEHEHEHGHEHEHEHEHVHEHEQEHEQEQEQREWLLDGKNDRGELFLQRCTAENESTEEFGGFGGRKDEEEEEEMDGEEDEEEEEEEDMDGDEEGDDFHHVFNSDSLDGDGFTGNFIQGIESNQIGFTSLEQHLPNASTVGVRADVQQHIASAPSFFNNSGKRVIEHDYDHGVNDISKRLRINEPADFGMCMEQIQQMAQRARMLYEEREQAAEQSGMNQQILMNELQKRDAMIEHLHKVRVDEMQKKDFEINRLERELYLIGSVLSGYRKALKEVKKSFAEYKERAQLPEESTYKDAGPGGLMLTAAEMERQRKKREEEFRVNCLIVEQKAREVEEEYSARFDGFVDRINLFDRRLISLEEDAKELVASYSSKKKIPEAEEGEHEAPETQLPAEEPKEAVAVAEPEEAVAVAEEVPRPPQETEADEEMAEAEDDIAIPQSEEGKDEKIVEAAEETLPIE
ncbi:probable serine/threonine-protein kinase kinX [Salvia hispanica]|uniref:probable serine/threonine-protein kinase kinX n=1 Tax=Salvia hispanica TaxID=49212 RepID=UPI0020093675|nr:probable serine/threonine-protein kinase kinX [Salvia hispanica]